MQKDGHAKKMAEISKLKKGDVSRYVPDSEHDFRVDDSPIDIEEFEEEEVLHGDRMFGYTSELQYTKSGNVYTFDLKNVGFQKLLIFESPDTRVDALAAIRGDRIVAINISNTLDALRTVKRAFQRNSTDLTNDIKYQRKVTDQFVKELNSVISTELYNSVDTRKYVDDVVFRHYMIGSLERGRLEIQTTMITKIANEIVNAGKDYKYGCIYSKDNIPVIHFLYKTKDNAMELTYWSKSFFYDYYTIGTKRSPVSIGPMALSLIIDSASAILGKPIDFINMEALYDTQRVIEKIQKDKIDIDLFLLPPDVQFELGFKERHLLVNTPQLSAYWQKFVDAEEPEMKRTKCVQCGIIHTQLYRGAENLIFCGDYCHQDYASDPNNIKSFL